MQKPLFWGRFGNRQLWLSLDSYADGGIVASSIDVSIFQFVR